MKTEEELRTMWNSGSNIGAIKELRAITGCGIKEAHTAFVTDTVGAVLSEHARVVARKLVADAGADLLTALETTLDKYVALASSGDCGFWDPETEEHVKLARAAIQKAKGG